MASYFEFSSSLKMVAFCELVLSATFVKKLRQRRKENKLMMIHDFGPRDIYSFRLLCSSFSSILYLTENCNERNIDFLFQYFHNFMKINCLCEIIFFPFISFLLETVGPAAENICEALV